MEGEMLMAGLNSLAELLWGRQALGGEHVASRACRRLLWAHFTAGASPWSLHQLGNMAGLALVASVNLPSTKHSILAPAHRAETWSLAGLLRI